MRLGVYIVYFLEKSQIFSFIPCIGENKFLYAKIIKFRGNKYIVFQFLIPPPQIIKITIQESTE